MIGWLLHTNLPCNYLCLHLSLYFIHRQSKVIIKCTCFIDSGYPAIENWPQVFIQNIHHYIWLYFSAKNWIYEDKGIRNIIIMCSNRVWSSEVKNQSHIPQDSSIFSEGAKRSPCKRRWLYVRYWKCNHKSLISDERRNVVLGIRMKSKVE